MALRVKEARTLITKQEFRQARFDILQLTVNRLLGQVPGAQWIEITVSEYYDDDRKADDLCESWCPANAAGE